MAFTGTVTQLLRITDARDRVQVVVERDAEGNPTKYLWGCVDESPMLPLKEEVIDYTFRDGICINAGGRRFVTKEGIDDEESTSPQGAAVRSRRSRGTDL